MLSVYLLLSTDRIFSLSGLCFNNNERRLFSAFLLVFSDFIIEILRYERIARTASVELLQQWKKKTDSAIVKKYPWK